MKRIVVAMLLLFHASIASAMQVRAPQPDAFRTTAEETRFHTLTSSLRCVMCQNESLADSDAPIAHDLRREILELMRDGKTDAQIRDFLVARYGEFVLYQPRVEPATWLLWFGPLVVLATGAATVAWIVRQRAVRARAVGDPSIGGPSADILRASESSEEW